MDDKKNKVHFLLNMNNNGDRLTIKSLFKTDSSFNNLTNEVTNLPPVIQAAKPFIVNIKSLLADANLTTQKLEAMKVQ